VLGFSKWEVLQTWTAKYSYQFRRASTIVADRDDIAQLALLALAYRVEYIDEVVCSAAAREDDQALRLVVAHCYVVRGKRVESEESCDLGQSLGRERPRSSKAQIIALPDTVS
jgi:hypothetical protein